MRSIRSTWPITAYLAGVLLPLALAWMSGGRLPRWSTLLGAVLGLAGLAMLLLQFLSLGRIERLCGPSGPRGVLRFHRIAAQTLAVMVLLHPLFLALLNNRGRMFGLWQRLAGLFVAPQMASGVIAWVALLVLTGLAIHRRNLEMPHEVWRVGHVLLALVAAVSSVHHALTVEGYGAALPLQAFWWMLAALAAGAMLHAWVLRPRQIARSAYRVDANRVVGPGIREMTLSPARGRTVRFEAGQFAWVILGRAPLPWLDHPLSISSSPSMLPRVQLLVEERGNFTRRLGRLEPGARAYLDLQHGHFTLRGRAGEALTLIAGGIGIAPVMSLLRQLRDSKDPRPVGAVYAARSAAHLVCLDEIVAMAQIIDLRCEFFAAERTPGWTGMIGEPSEDAVRGALRAEASQCLCFVCGPAALIAATLPMLREAGVPAGQIVVERFEFL